MKRGIKIGAVLVVSAGVAAGAIFGPQLWAGYHFMEAVDQQTREYEANGGPWPQLQDTCILCHGQDGQSQNTQYPALAGLSASYIEDQLHAFAQGERHSPPMASIARRLTDENIEMLAAYYERQAPEIPTSVADNTATFEQGKRLVTDKACAACHGDQLQGSPIAPRLAGQSEMYLADQLIAFKQGDRKDPTQAMNGLSKTLSDDDIKATAYYLAHTPPTDADGN
ncbi:MAG: c-type cytochrome [Alcanivorax sp.]|uniref:c-type cytochrome n=1 Tax=Alcanivorax sp. TaxID=1872427 RepID=UPI0026310DE7|nr:c-type cytochrome [Alcanivorax sp.]MDF1723479.1 c-type cytochrome [Alcanivorax sp.]